MAQRCHLSAWFSRAVPIKLVLSGLPVPRLSSVGHCFEIGRDPSHVGQGFGRRHGTHRVNIGKVVQCWRAGNIGMNAGFLSIRQELRQIKIAGNFPDHGGRDGVLPHGATERQRVGTEIVDVAGNAFTQLRNGLLSLCAEQRARSIPQPSAGDECSVQSARLRAGSMSRR